MGLLFEAINVKITNGSIEAIKDYSSILITYFLDGVLIILPEKILGVFFNEKS